MNMYGRDELFSRIAHDPDDELLWKAIENAENINRADDSGLTYLHVATIN